MALGAEVKADEVAVEIVDYFLLAAGFGEEDSQAARKRLAIAFVRWNAGEDVFEVALFAS
jgi:ribose 5-phosphate isomerase RpiB